MRTFLMLMLLTGCAYAACPSPVLTRINENEVQVVAYRDARTATRTTACVEADPVSYGRKQIEQKIALVNAQIDVYSDSRKVAALIANLQEELTTLTAILNTF